MPDTTHDATHRTHNTTPQRVEYREPENADDVFEVRMPIATTGEVRNDGDDPLTRDELDGMAQQINNRSIGVFLDHGGTNLGGASRYSAMEKIGEWREAETQTRESDDEGELVATARIMNPETLPAGVGPLREAIGAIREQVKRGFSLSSSIGWREDDSYPGGNDLMEASIVGIGADPRTTSGTGGVEVVARAAVEAGVDPEELLGVVERAVREDMPDDTDNESTSDEVDAEQNESDESRDAPEWAERMLELQEQTTDTLQELADSLREDTEDEDEDDEESEDNASDEDDEDDEDEEQDAEPDSEQSAEEGEGDLRERIAAMEDALNEVRSGEGSVASPGDDSEDSGEEQRDTDTEPASENWRDYA